MNLNFKTLLSLTKLNILCILSLIIILILIYLKENKIELFFANSFFDKFIVNQKLNNDIQKQMNIQIYVIISVQLSTSLQDIYQL